ncbi:MAG: 50S ribosomal protein L6 [Campylobacterales bacterium]|nr:50S ribosomal protein L6 [Campylobacterales bacterium]
MSRIGKKPIAIPNGMEATVNGSVITVKKGNKSIDVETHGRVGIEVADNNIVFTLKGEEAQDKAYWGTYRALTNNAVIGLNEGFKKSLEINGVGYRAAVKGNILELQLGYSHPVNYEIPEGIEITVEKNVVNVTGSSKQEVGQVAAIIRGFRPPEPYKGKGVKYTDEKIIRKAGKTSKK